MSLSQEDFFRIIRRSGERTMHLKFISGRLHQLYLLADNQYEPCGPKMKHWLPVESDEMPPSHLEAGQIKKAE